MEISFGRHIQRVLGAKVSLFRNEWYAVQNKMTPALRVGKGGGELSRSCLRFNLPKAQHDKSGDKGAQFMAWADVASDC